MNYSSLNIIKQITKYPTRQSRHLLAVEKYICDLLEIHTISYTRNSFVSKVPECISSLIVDGKKIPTKGCSFKSGDITSKECILSSTTPSRYNLDNSNINFNPFANAISQSNYYFAPAVAISKNYLLRVIQGKKIKGRVTVKKISTRVSHILVGNKKNPKSIVFAHYDSISRGAIDNASGVAVVLHCILNNRFLLKNTLFVFDPNEELSFDKPTYWGHGFRVFENKFSDIMVAAKKIIPIDCVGNGPVIVDNDPKILYLAFPIRQFEKFKDKIITLYSNIQGLMTVYHSDDDTFKNISAKYLKDAEEKLIKLLKK